MRLGSSKSCNMACHNNYTAMLIELANEFIISVASVRTVQTHDRLYLQP
jgi:hypothetical protein